MRAIFISYRRDDAEGEAGRLFADLTVQFGADRVFMDVTGIEPGRDFRKVIDQNVSSCGVLLAVVGKGWTDAKDEDGRRRLDDPMDFVRLETASALKRDIPVIPVLVHGGRMPRAEQLPEDLKDLAYRNAVELTHARWNSDVQILIKALRPHVGDGKEEAEAMEAKPAPPVVPPQPPKRFSRTVIVAFIAAIVIAVGTIAAYEYKKWGETTVQQTAGEKAAEEKKIADKAAAERASAERAAADKGAADRTTADKSCC